MDKENLNKQFEHAWKYFELHATQRITLFRYYIVFFTFFITGYLIVFIKFPEASTLQEIAGIAICIPFCVLTYIFQCLNDRNRNLIHIAEESLIYLESNMQFDTNIKIFSKDNENKPSYWKRHTGSFRIIFYQSYLLSILLLLAALESILFYSVHCSLIVCISIFLNVILALIVIVIINPKFLQSIK